MTGDERDRILGLLSAGPATVARLAAGLGLPGGVVNYQLTLLQREGLARVGTTRVEHGVVTSVWVSTAAAAPPPLPIPAPLPGLTWTGDGPYPAPVWTTPRSVEPAPAGPAPTPAGPTPAGPTPAGPASVERAPADAEVDQPGSARREGGQGRSGDEGRSGAPDESAATRRPARKGTARPAAGGSSVGPSESHAEGDRSGADTAARIGDSRTMPARFAPEAGSPPSWPTWAPQPRRPDQADAGPARRPRLFDVRRVPIDDATFYEFASRLDELAREFAARAVPGAPTTELTIVLNRPAGDGSPGHGS